MPFLILPFFLLFLAILAYFRRKSTNSQKEAEERFWQREQQANETRRQDISGLDYIIIPLEKFPLNLHTDAEQTIQSLADKKILNLTGLSNTDLKLQYGAANLDILSEYEENFVTLVSQIPVYAKELLDTGDLRGAQAVLEFGVDCRADVGQIYTMLADIYQDAQKTEEIERLIDVVKELPTFSKNVIISKLEAMTKPAAEQ